MPMGPSRPGPRGREPGFTIIELLVVIAITIILAAIALPMGRMMQESNQMMACTANLQAIGHAIKMYTLDMGAVPPPYDPNNAGAQNNLPSAPIGLYRLVFTGYLSKPTTLHCPADTRDAQHHDINPSSPQWFHSYDTPDLKAKYLPANPIGTLAQYKYMPYRGAASTDPDFHRQLAPPDPVNPALALYTPTWTPDDSAVVCWCNFHADKVIRNGDGAYNVLYWGGEVLVKGASLMRDTGKGPTEAWRITP